MAFIKENIYRLTKDVTACVLIDGTAYLGSAKASATAGLLYKYTGQGMSSIDRGYEPAFQPIGNGHPNYTDKHFNVHFYYVSFEESDLIYLQAEDC